MPELVPIRYGRMLVSPFTFFRGAALIMASDLSTTPRSGLTAQICGDAHLSNFGVFGSPERQLVFDCNDFDETLPGPWEWDVKRLAASIVVAGRASGLLQGVRTEAIVGLGQVYREAMRQMATMSNLEVWYCHVEIGASSRCWSPGGRHRAPRPRPSMAATATKVVAKAQTKDSMRALDKLTYVVDGERRIISDPPLIVPVEELFPEVRGRAMVRACSTTSCASTARACRPTAGTCSSSTSSARWPARWSGVGSVGTRAWIILLHGARQEDVLFLQAKEAEASVLERFTKKSQYANHGARVVAGQRLMQASSDIFLGWQRTDGVDGVTRDYYVRQLQDWKGSVDTDNAMPAGHEGLRRAVRPHAGPGPRPLGRPDRHGVVSRQQRHLREGAGQVRRVLRRPERAGLRGVRGRLQERPAPRRGGDLSVTEQCVAEWRRAPDDVTCCP